MAICTQAEPTDPEGRKSETGANYIWEWHIDRLKVPNFQATPQYKLLIDLVTKPGQKSPPPDAYVKLERMAERGVYKSLASWLEDKLKGKQTKSFREYSAQPESAVFESLLNIADLISQGIIGDVLAPMVGIPPVVVSLGLIVGKFGYRKLVEAK